MEGEKANEAGARNARRDCGWALVLKLPDRESPFQRGCSIYMKRFTRGSRNTI